MKKGRIIFMKKKISEGYVEVLESVDKKIKIDDVGLKITEDSLLLANFIKEIFNNKGNCKRKISNETVLEIGAGQGIISILLCKAENIGKIYAVELQKKVFDILEENIKKNFLEDKIIPLNENIKNISGEYDFIFSNPPYRKINSGRLPENEEVLKSKYEVELTLEEAFSNIKRLLKNCGEFCVIVPDDRLNDSFFYIYANKMNILSLKIKRYGKRNLIVIHGRKGGKLNSEIKIYSD